MICMKCGKETGSSNIYCDNCKGENPKVEIPTSETKNERSVSQSTVTSSTQNTDYAGFWLRFSAYIYDYLIFLLIFIIPTLILATGINEINELSSESNPQSGSLATNVASFLFSCAVLALFESSKLKATPGKLLMGIKVTSSDGGRLGFSAAFMRNVLKIVSGILFGIGFLMIAFTRKKQGLHDMWTSAYIVKDPQVTVRRVVFLILAIILTVATFFYAIKNVVETG